jgi:hypothetical protein
LNLGGIHRWFLAVTARGAMVADPAAMNHGESWRGRNGFVTKEMASAPEHRAIIQFLRRLPTEHLDRTHE